MSKKNSSINSLKLGTSITIDTVKKYEEQFKSLLNKKSEIIFTSEIIDSIDLAGIQFLIYTKNIAEQENIKIQFNLQLSPNSRELIDKTGFLHLFEK